MTHRWLPHTADVRVEITAPSLPGLLSHATGAVRELLVGHSVVQSEETRFLSVTASDEAELVLGFLRAMFELYHRDQFVPAEAEVGEPIDTAEGICARATVRGERFDAGRHEAQPEVKAVTRHGLRVARTAAGWTADVVFDV